jgi:hypothetical protein
MTNDMTAAAGHLPTWWRARDEAARRVAKFTGRRMSDRTLRRAAFVVANGSKALVAEMNAERISIAAAAALACLPADMQATCIANRKVRREVLRVLREKGE